MPSTDVLLFLNQNPINSRECTVKFRLNTANSGYESVPRWPKIVAYVPNRKWRFVCALWHPQYASNGDRESDKFTDMAFRRLFFLFSVFIYSVSVWARQCQFESPHPVKYDGSVFVFTLAIKTFTWNASRKFEIRVRCEMADESGKSAPALRCCANKWVSSYEMGGPDENYLFGRAG